MTTMASRRCADCGTDISGRHGNAIRCVGCVIAHRKAYNQVYFQRSEIKAKRKMTNRTCVDCGVDISVRGGKAIRCVGCATTRLKAQVQAYNQRPEAKAKQRAYHCVYEKRPEVKVKVKAYRQRPEVQVRVRTYQEAHRQRPEVQASRQEYLQRPEVKAKNRIHNNSRRHSLGGHKPRRYLPMLIERSALCGLCFKPLPKTLSDIHVDHIQPLSLGGGSDMSNLQAVHKWCNLSKSNSVVPQNLVLL